MKTSIRALLAILAVLALTVGAVACGDDDESSDSGGTPAAQDTGTQDSGGTAIQKDSANASKTITIGSKNFPEQYILGEIYAQGLEAAGFTVKKQLDLGSEQVAFKALKTGTVDMYPEYTGTALTSFYRVKTDEVPRDPQESFDLLKENAAKDQIVAQPQTQFEDTFRIASTKETAEKYGNPKTLSELKEKAGNDISISGFPECRQRTDCLLGLKNVYDWQPKFVSSQGKFADLDGGQSDLTFGFSTDGEFALDKYASYEDDKSLFPPYYVTLLTRQDAYDTLGESGQKVIQDVQKGLTEEAMQELNSRVTLDKQEPEAVAGQYLQELGYVN
jgi:glycine betaine/choline ABC-type transport system substrate-binding protein